MIGFPTMKRMLCLCLLVLSVAACSGTNLMSTGEKFDQTSKDGVLIVGLANSPSNGQTHSINWQPVDPATNTFTGGLFGTLVSSRLMPLSFFAQDVESDYFIHRVPAGTYAIFDAQGVYGQVGMTTLAYRIRFKPTTLAVRVNPGEIVYVGNFVIAMGPGSHPSQFRNLFHYAGPDMEAVRIKLKEFPNVKGPLIYRKPFKVRIGQPGDQ